MTDVLVASHGHCFDGLVSAALFSDLLQHMEPSSRFTYRALGYGPHQRELQLDAEQNVVLDYRYVPHPHLTYYLDHHATAFVSAEDRRDFEERQKSAPLRFVYDEAAPSCATLVAKLARHSGFDSPVHRDLELWANQVDAAQFDTVDDAIDLDSPLLQVVNTVTHFGDHQFYKKAIPHLLREGLLGLHEQRWVKDKFHRLRPAIEALNLRIRRNGEMVGRVAWINLMDETSHVVSKFRQYYEFPSAIYSVILHRSDEYLRLSVGYNPWSKSTCDVHIGAMCQEYGGGGHAVVGAIGFSDERMSEALTIAQHMIARLNRPGEAS